MVKVKTLNGGRGCERIRMSALNPAHSSSVAASTDVKGPVGISNAEGDSNEVPQSCSRGTKGLDPEEAASKNFNIQQHHRKNCTSPLVSWPNGGICVLNFFVICCKAHAELDKSARASRSYHIISRRRISAPGSLERCNRPYFMHADSGTDVDVSMEAERDPLQRSTGLLREVQAVHGRCPAKILTRAVRFLYLVNMRSRETDIRARRVAC
jgi:hypothetical protein